MKGDRGRKVKEREEGGDDEVEKSFSDDGKIDPKKRATTEDLLFSLSSSYSSHRTISGETARLRARTARDRKAERGREGERQTEERKRARREDDDTGESAMSKE